jgi:hypothetical protein
MVTHMKTTVDIADDVLLRAKEVAKNENVTLKSLIERGLLVVLEKKNEKRNKITLVTVDGEGVNPKYEAMSWDEKLEVIYGDGGDRL